MPSAVYLYRLISNVGIRCILMATFRQIAVEYIPPLNSSEGQYRMKLHEPSVSWKNYSSEKCCIISLLIAIKTPKPNWILAFFAERFFVFSFFFFLLAKSNPLNCDTSKQIGTIQNFTSLIYNIFTRKTQKGVHQSANSVDGNIVARESRNPFQIHKYI